ncbi:MAG: hypothetical protein F4W92_08020 [Gammaproteobacteria bacterium]|nr:hypothetical protein [Gammaproteobacteria bacterium]
MQRLIQVFSRTETISFAVSLLVGVGVSLILWQVVSPVRQNQQLTESAEGSHTSTSIAPSTSSITVNLNTILELKSPTDRSTAIYTLVGGLNGEQILALLNETLSFTASTTVQSIQATLLEELTWADPIKAVSFVKKFDPQRSVDLVSIVFTEWAQFNLDDALQATSELHTAIRSRALWAIFFSRPDIAVSERVTLVGQHSEDPTLVRRLVTEASTRQSLDEPLAALQTIIDDEIDDKQQITALYKLTDYWYHRDGISSIGEMLDRFYTQFQNEHSLLRDLVEKVAAFDPQTAWNHVLTLPIEVQQKLAPMVVSEWGAIDFETAHQAVIDANMSFALGVLFQSLASSDPERALAEIDQVPLDYGLSVFMRLVNRLPRDVILDHLEHHGRLGPDTAMMVRLLVQSWSSEEPESAVEWLLTNLPHYDWIDSEHLLRGLISLGSIDLERAFAIALEQPKDESASGMEYALIVELMRNGQMEGIEPFLKRVREPKQFDGYKVMGLNLIEIGKFDEAFALGSQLPESKWPDYFRQLTSTGIWRNSELFIAKMSELPNKEIRSDVARQIIGIVDMKFYPSRHSISDTDLRYIRSLITED